MKEFIIKLEDLPKLEVDAFVESQETSTIEEFLKIAPSELVNKVLENSKDATLKKISSSVRAEVIKSALERASDKALRYYVDGSSFNSLRKLSASSPNSLIERLIDVAADQQHREIILKALPLERRKQWETYLSREKKRAAELRNSLNQTTESLVEERKRIADELSAAIRAKEEALAEAENVMRAKKQHLAIEISDAKERLETLTLEATEREQELKLREESLAQKIAELDEEHQKQVQQRIEIKVPEYVSAAVKVLEALEENFKNKARAWSIHGTVVIVLAVAITIAISLTGAGIIDEKIKRIEWPLLIFISFKGLVILSVLGLWARHAFNVSNAYMHEAIKRSDRAHAINFGKLYFEIYGNSVERSELVHIFENWNIASESAFSKIKLPQENSQVVEQVKELVKAIKLVDKKAS